MNIIFQLVGTLFSFFPIMQTCFVVSNVLAENIPSQQSVKQRKSTYPANKGNAVLKLSKQMLGFVVL